LIPSRTSVSGLSSPEYLRSRSWRYKDDDALTRPGMTVFPERSSTRVSDGTGMAGPIFSIFPSVIKIIPLWRVPDSPMVKMRAFFKRTRSDAWTEKDRTKSKTLIKFAVPLIIGFTAFPAYALYAVFFITKPKFEVNAIRQNSKPFHFRFDNMMESCIIFAFPRTKYF
jgi:hypothetical protein